MPVLNTADRVYAGSDLVEKIFHGTNLVWASGPFLQLTGRTAVENASVGTNVGTLSVANPGTGTPTYTLTDSAGGRFSITGALLKVAGALDYETAQSHSVTVHVTGMTPNPADRSFLILVTDVDDTPATITSSNTVSNVENTTLAHALTANEPVTWSIVGGADSARFELSGSTLRWVGNGAKDFEAPNDSDTNNAYIVQVRATDLASNITNQTITVTVTDVDEVAPTITSSATVSNAENSVLAHALTANETVTWSIVGGADAARFEISGSTLRWLSNGTKDFETPNDADANNAYIVQVRATDLGSNQTNQTITVTVTDVTESGTTTVTASNGMSWTFPGTVPNGTYVNGDVWVFTSTTLPMPTLSTPATGSGATARNGGMINPTFNTLVEAPPYGSSYSTAANQGFDGRATENAATPPGYPPCMDYSDAYNAHINGSVLHPGDSLVSCESLNDAEYAAITSNKRAIWRMACLTVVNYTPFADEFRPAYFGTTKTRRRFSELNTALLPNRTPNFDPKGVTSNDWHIDSSSIYIGADGGLPFMTQAQQMRVTSCVDLQYFITPHRSSRSTYSLLSPAANMYWYPRDRGNAWGALACRVLHNFSDRDTFLARLVQIAIDGYEVAAGFSGAAPFSCGAGFFCTPLWLIRFAGLLFNDTNMKNAASMTTGKTDYWGDPVYKWGEQTRVYFKSGAYGGYRLPAGYSGLTPLFADTPFQDTTAGQGSNGTARNPTQIYDVYPYREQPAQHYGTVAANSSDAVTLKIIPTGIVAWDVDDYWNGCTIAGFIDGVEEKRTITDFVASTMIVTVNTAFSANPDNNDKFIIYPIAFPNILDDAYAQLPDPLSPGNLGTYMGANQFGTMGMFMASIMMNDEAFWGGNGAIQAFNRRYANDPQMWEDFGKLFDYNTNFTTGDGKFRRDIKGFGGSGNGWMADLWDALNIISPGAMAITGQDIVPVLQTHTFSTSIEAGALAISGQSITPNYATGGSPVTVFEYVVLGSEAGEPGWGGYIIRQKIGAANMGAASGLHARVTLMFRVIGVGTIIDAYIGQRAASGDPYDTTAMTQLKGGDFAVGGTYTVPATAGYVTIASDWVLLNETYDETKDYIVSVSMDGAVQSMNIADANNAVHYVGVAAGTAGVADTSGYVFADNSNKLVAKIEIKG